MPPSRHSPPTETRSPRSVHLAPCDPGLLDLDLPDVGRRYLEHVLVDENEIGPFASLERAQRLLLMLSVSGIHGEGAERFQQRHGLRGLPAAGRLIGVIGARDRG